MTAALGSTNEVDPRDAEITQLRDQLAQARAASSTTGWAVIVELARITQAARTNTETVSDEWGAGRRHVLDLIEKRLTELRGPRGRR